MSEILTGVIHIGNYTGKIIIVLAVLLSNSLLFIVFSQKNAQPFQGQVTDMSGKAVSFATVNFLGTNQGTVTDHNGHFSFWKFPQNVRALEVRCLGYETKVIELGEKEHIRNALTIQLEAATEELSEAVVRGKSRTQQKMEKPIKIEAIDATKFQAQSTTLPQIINQTAGVKVRQSAGVGSGTTININGLQGRAIRYFRDDIPLDYLGHAYELSLVPIGQLSGIEIYKGVLPAKLGADALGGAVNFLTRDFNENQLDLSYSYGSFNTHQANLAGYWQIPGTKLFAQVSSYHVYSDNDYKMAVNVTDPVTRTLKPAEVKRFHNAIESSFVEAKTGIKNTKVADLFEIGYAGFSFNREEQHGFNINRAFGEVWHEETFNAFTSRYRKEIKKLNIDLFGAYSQKSTLAVDTSSRRYNWFGNVITTGWTNGGESDNANKSILTLDFDHLVGRMYLAYQIGTSTISFNHNLVNQNRTGSDPLGYRIKINNKNIDPFSVPAEYFKKISGLQLTNTHFNEKLTYLVTAKRYEVVTSSLSRTSFEDLSPELTSTSYGFGSSLKYSFTENRFLRLSYEKATRIPEAEEYFGDGRFIIGNNNLKPERSDNVNFGIYTNIDKNQNIYLDVNTFYRLVDNQIVLQPLWTFIHSQFQNKDVAEIKGIESTLKALLFKNVRVNFGITYQDARRIKIDDRAEQNAEGARLRYTPFFFTNLLLNYDHSGLFKEGDLASIYINHSFVEKYPYLMIPKSQELSLFEPKQNSPITNIENQIIPSQNIVDMGIIYKWRKLPLWINLEVNNLLNTEAFDNYRIPKPPRNFRVKVRYVLSNT